jgi:hypothetical protein
LVSIWNLKYSKSSIKGAGTQTAALGFGGYSHLMYLQQIEYDGSSWVKLRFKYSKKSLGELVLKQLAVLAGYRWITFYRINRRI